MTTRAHFPHRTKERQEEALVRQKAYNASTTKDKVANIESRPGNSKKELHRLHHG
jgi:hypothetical protein